MILEINVFSQGKLVLCKRWTTGTSEIRAAMDRIESALMVRTWTHLRSILEYDVKLDDMEAVL